jgi:ceramide glucosyltransferase
MIGIIVIVLISAGLLYTLISFYFTRKFFRNPGSGDFKKFTANGISILKPIKGIDDRLESNLVSFFNLDYPEFELLFGINDTKDPAIKLIKKLQKRYPDVKTKLIVSNNHVGLNPKVNNLHNLYPHASHDYLLISDSNVHVPSNYLSEMMVTMSEPGVGLVTSVFRGVGAKSMGAIFENLHLNTFLASSVITVDRLFHRPITIGKSMLFKRTLIDRLAGFSSLANVLAEDHLLGVHIQKSGYSVKTSGLIIDNVNENWNLERFMNRHIRWAKMRKSINVIHYTLETITNPIYIALIFALATARAELWLLFLITVMIKTGIDIMILRSLKSSFKVSQYLLLPVKDILMGFLWLVPFVNNRINWRGNNFRIGKGTQIMPYNGRNIV